MQKKLIFEKRKQSAKDAIVNDLIVKHQNVVQMNTKINQLQTIANPYLFIQRFKFLFIFDLKFMQFFEELNFNIHMFQLQFL